MLEKVRNFAIEAHGSQKYGEHDYAYHLDAVAERLKTWYDGPWADMSGYVAYLHDVLEDTEKSYQDIIELIGPIDGPFVAQIVFNVTNGNGANRIEKLYNTMYKIRSHEFSVILKMADRYCNTKELEKRKMYRKEFPIFKAGLYTPGQFEEQWKELEELTFRDD